MKRSSPAKSFQVIPRTTYLDPPISTRKRLQTPKKPNFLPGRNPPIKHSSHHRPSLSKGFHLSRESSIAFFSLFETESARVFERSYQRHSVKILLRHPKTIVHIFVIGYGFNQLQSQNGFPPSNDLPEMQFSLFSNVYCFQLFLAKSSIF